MASKKLAELAYERNQVCIFDKNWHPAVVHLKSVLDFTHAHLHKCMYFLLSASKILHPTCPSACKFSIICFMMLVDIYTYTMIKR